MLQEPELFLKKTTKDERDGRENHFSAEAEVTSLCDIPCTSFHFTHNSFF